MITFEGLGRRKLLSHPRIQGPQSTAIGAEQASLLQQGINLSNKCPHRRIPINPGRADLPATYGLIMSCRPVRLTFLTVRFFGPCGDIEPPRYSTVQITARSIVT